jgi:tRNA nucleotidyltransferase (CCA-adding enzyme)
VIRTVSLQTGGIHIHIPREAEEIITILEANGHEAYLVGGCVRDALMGLTPKDYDICTSALPEQIIPLFDRTVPTGVKHGTVTVIIRSLPFEVTTFRTDADYTDHRRPDAVVFSESLAEDLKRRDFTINAMAYHPVKGVIDPFGGYDDLRNKVIRTVGNPQERFNEDALRMLRAIRFKARFGFSVHEAVLDAIKESAWTINYVSRERILSELNGILSSPFPEEIRAVFETGLSGHIFPPHVAVVPRLDRLKPLPEKLPLRWAALLWEIDVTEEEDLHLFCTSMKMGNVLKKDILAILFLLRGKLPKTGYGLRRTISETGIANFLDALALAERTGAFNADFTAIRQLLQDITTQQQCTRLTDLAVGGSDLLKAGFPAGRALGDLLSALFICVLQKPELNRKELLIEFARQIAKKQF